MSCLITNCLALSIHSQFMGMHVSFRDDEKVEEVVGNMETAEEWGDASSSTLTTSISLWHGCLFDTHCHLNLVNRCGQAHLFCV